MGRESRLIQVFNVTCVMCSRAAGHLVRGMFVPSGRTRAPLVENGIPRCGECGGNMYLEPDDVVTPFMAEQLTRQGVPQPFGVRAA